MPDDPPLVITAAHCLPHLPPAGRDRDSDERSYSGLLSPLGEPPTVAAECLFVDPIADVAVLGSVDNQERATEAAAFDRFAEGRPALRVGAVRQRGAGWVLSLEQQWQTMHRGCGRRWKVAHTR